MTKEKISIIIPVYNEKHILPLLVSRLKLALDKISAQYELIFVDDNSTDGSYEALLAMSSPTLKVIRKNGQKGKAFSLIQGFKEATGEILGMIDADLQYAPEDIPGMLSRLKKSDIVVANRKRYKDSVLRRTLSRTYRALFGKGLFNLNVDIQSGLKVFRKEVFDIVEFAPRTGWTFDLEFLHRANQAGFTMASHDITFHPRKNSKSKVHLVRSTLEIGANALNVKTKRIYPMHAKATNGSMLGAGVHYKKRKYVTHTTLPHNISALRTFEKKQQAFFFGVLLFVIAGFIVNPFVTGVVVIALLSTLYFIDTLFNFFVVMKSLQFDQEVSTPDTELGQLSDAALPIYTILCPLYRESHIIPHFLKAIEKMDWPKDRLDVMLLLEEDDTVSIEAVKEMKLPSYVRSIVVPDSQPKTKPKACNYGLSFALGEYLVIYDAEDIPDPMQLKKAYLAFGKVDKNVVCLQAKLNYFNPHQNLLTRFFTAEYSLWFDVSLTGLQSIGTVIPLGGTSNHFRTKDLHELQGWDPFNVTEDADLGMRLFKKGYRTAMIDSVTLEEANSNVRNWIRQRSRWIKGYMQTYLVHLRDIVTFSRQRGRHALIFQLVLGGKIGFILINPFLWITTISYFALHSIVGPTIESLFPTWVFYMAGFSLVFGNFLFLYYYMIGCLKRGHYTLIKYVYLVPLYWLLISISGFMAFYQLLFKPHYWEKTVHGLHLKKQVKNVVAELVVEVETEQRSWDFAGKKRKALISLIMSKKAYMGGVLLIIATVGANFLNFFFNAYLGRTLDFDDFANISLVASFSYLSILVSKGFGTTVTYKSGFFTGKSNHQSAYNYWSYMRKRAFLASLILTVIWIGLSPILSIYFAETSLLLFLSFGFVLLVGFTQAVDQAYLSGKLLFALLAFIIIFEPIIKNILALISISFNYQDHAYAIVPLTTILTFVFGWVLISLTTKKERKAKAISVEHYKFPFKLFLSSLFLGISSLAFLSFDVILATHFLPSQQAGEYALISLVGKMVYFLGSLGSTFITPLVSHSEGANKDSKRILYFSVLATSLLSMIGLVGFGAFADKTIPLLYGEKARVIVPYLLVFTAGMTAFTISKVIVSYYLIKKIYTLPLISLLLTVFQVLLVIKYHGSIQEIVLLMCLIGLLNLIAASVVHLAINYVKVFESNVRDFLGLFTLSDGRSIRTEKGFAILIFNWRDMKHKWAGGAEVYIHEIAKRWVQEGHSVTLFSGNDGKSSRNQTVDGIQVIRRGGFFTVYVWAAFYYFFKFRKNYDVVVDSENGIPFFSPIFSTRPVVLLIHHVHQEVFRKSLVWPASWVASTLEAKLMPLVYKNRQVVTVSPSSKAEILKHKLTKTDPTVIYNGVDLDMYRAGSKSANPLVLYVGRLQQYKSLNVFLKAAKIILEENPEVEFVIAGDGEDRKNLQKLSNKLGITDHVSFQGYISEKEKVRLFQKAWVFVNPSLMEGWGITTIEANACGTPVVASNVPGLRDSIKSSHTGLLVKYGDHIAFAEAISGLLATKGMRQKMSQASIEWSQNFSWDKSASVFLSVLTDEINKQREVSRVKKAYYVFNRVTSMF